MKYIQSVFNSLISKFDNLCTKLYLKCILMPTELRHYLKYNKITNRNIIGSL